MMKHWRSMANRLHVGNDKHLLAGPGRLLIDDHPGNCHDWNESGGVSILFPRPWNTRYSEQATFDFAAELEGFLRCS
jgi:hypothetical protein